MGRVDSKEGQGRRDGEGQRRAVRVGPDDEGARCADQLQHLDFVGSGAGMQPHGPDENQCDQQDHQSPERCERGDRQPADRPHLSIPVEIAAQRVDQRPGFHRTRNALDHLLRHRQRELHDQDIRQRIRAEFGGGGRKAGLLDQVGKGGVLGPDFHCRNTRKIGQAASQRLDVPGCRPGRDEHADLRRRGERQKRRTSRPEHAAKGQGKREGTGRKEDSEQEGQWTVAHHCQRAAQGITVRVQERHAVIRPASMRITRARLGSGAASPCVAISTVTPASAN